MSAYAPPVSSPETLKVINSSVTVTQNGSPAWVEYRPYDDWAEVCLDGRRSKLADVQLLSDLISIIDEAEGLARTKDDLAGC